MWHKIAKIPDFADGRPQLVAINDTPIAVFKENDRFFALENRCAHKGGPLVEGSIENSIVTCPWHAWSFDLGSGACKNMPGAKQKTYPVKIEAQDIFIDV